MTPTLDNIDFTQLTVDQRLQLIGRIWDTLDPDNECIPLPSWHLDVIRERVAADEANPDQRTDWNEFRRELLSE